MADGEQSPGEGAGEGLARMTHITGKIVVPATATTALLVYFGWARSSAIYEVFDIDHRVLGFSVQDYLLDSVKDTFVPATLLLLAILVAIPAHFGLMRMMRESRWRKRTVLPLFATGMVLTVVGLLGFLSVVTYPVTWPIVPLSLGLGVLLIGYSAALWRATGGAPRGPLGGSEVVDVLTRVTFVAFLTLTLFWSMAIYAQEDGRQYGETIAQHVASLPGVVVISAHPLFLQEAGARETVLIGDQQIRYYRYDWLRLLVRASGRYFLLPLDWRPGRDVAVLPDDPAVRLEFFEPVASVRCLIGGHLGSERA
ncbi:MAG: hypothetical protein ACRDRS_17765 [Pseudonocardiaceae bacterium]